MENSFHSYGARPESEFDGVHNYTSADSTDPAAAPTQGDEGTARNFVAGSKAASPTCEHSPGVWGPGFTKSG